MLEVIRNEIERRPFASTITALGSILIVLGLVLGNQAAASYHVGLMGDMVAVIGTVLATIASAYAFGEASATKLLTSRLDILLRQLATSSAHISQAVHDAAHGQNEEISFAKIAQAINTLTVVTGDLEKLGGSRISTSSEELIASRRQIEDLGRQLTSIDILIDEIEEQAMRDPSKLQKELEELRNTINAVKLPTPEVTTCPKCKAAIDFEMPPGLGRTVGLTCRKCQTSFSVHRGRDGVFAGSLPDAPSSNLPMNSVNVFLPDAAERESILRHVYKEWKDGKIATANDIPTAIESSGREHVQRAVVRQPLFWALINNVYGVLSLDDSANVDLVPLRDRPVKPHTTNGSEDKWVHDAHAAWISQFIYRLRTRNRQFTVQQLAEGLFEIPNEENIELVRQAEENAELDLQNSAAASS